MRSTHMAGMVAAALWLAAGEAPAAPVVLNDDGAWCWFQDERALLQRGKLFVATVAAGFLDPGRRGNIEVVTYDVKSGQKERAVLHPRLERDDHDSPALFVRPDGRLLAMYCKHNPESRHYLRVSARPGGGAEWRDEQQVAWSPASRVTYSNLHFLRAENGGKGRLYNLFRGLDGKWKPSWSFSDDGGDTWKAGGLLVDFTDPASPGRRHRPYAKYASNGRDTIHFIFTEGHPGEYSRTSLYHALYRDGSLCRADGTRVRALAEGPIQPAEATRVFAGDPENIAWPCDLHLDRAGRPYLAFSVRKGANHQDHRYHYARWDGTRWTQHEIAFAGSRLYPGEEDYTGNVALHPADPNRLFISTNVDPAAGTPLPSGHWELFEGVTVDGGAHWRWTPLTPGAAEDHLRPVVPISDGGSSFLLWMQGKYNTYTDWKTRIVGVALR